MNFEMVTIKYDDLSAAFDFVSCAAPWEHQAFVSLDTGAIYWVSETSPVDDEEQPDDLEALRRWCEENQIPLAEPTVTLE